MKKFKNTLAFFFGIRYNNPCSNYGRLAQLVELPLDVRKVTGSSPVPSTIKSASAMPVRFCFFIKNYPAGRNRRDFSFFNHKRKGRKGQGFRFRHIPFRRFRQVFLRGCRRRKCRKISYPENCRACFRLWRRGYKGCSRWNLS